MMKTIKARTSNEPTSLSFSRRYFNFKKMEGDEDNDELVLNYNQSSSHSFSGVTQFEKQESILMRYKSLPTEFSSSQLAVAPRKKKLPKLRSALAIFGKSKSSPTLGSKLIGTLFGFRRGNVHIAFQEDPKTKPTFMIQISTPTSFLVKQMASGLVRVAFECEKKKVEKKSPKLLDEPLWRAYCNGNKCGYATRQECGPDVIKVLAAMGPITMGAGVLPGEEEVGEDGELMYMRARFERIAGSKDSESFYMINPDGNGGPELSLFFLRV